MADTNSNLKASFQQGFNVFKRIETDENPGNSKNFQDNVCEAINCLRRAVEMVNELALFSMNEELDDISTNNIRYLLLPALLGELYLKLCTGERIDVVGISKVYLLDFLERCKTYGLLQQDVNLQQSSEGSLARNQRSLEDLASERQAKITRYKMLKEQEKQIQDISEVLEDSSVLFHDEELERKYNILLLENWVNKALEHLSSINSELQILEHIEKLKRQGQDRENTKNTDKATRDEKTNNKKTPVQASRSSPGSGTSQTLLAKPILITRQTMQSKVFGAGYPSLPSMTQEEYFEKELREGKIVAEFRDKLTTKTESEKEKDEEEVDSCEDEKYLEKLKKDREWDDWKDDHRRGWGNRENMG